MTLVRRRVNDYLPVNFGNYDWLYVKCFFLCRYWLKLYRFVNVDRSQHTNFRRRNKQVVEYLFVLCVPQQSPRSRRQFCSRSAALLVSEVSCIFFVTHNGAILSLCGDYLIVFSLQNAISKWRKLERSAKWCNLKPGCRQKVQKPFMERRSNNRPTQYATGFLENTERSVWVRVRASAKDILTRCE